MGARRPRTRVCGSNTAEKPHSEAATQEVSLAPIDRFRPTARWRSRAGGRNDCCLPQAKRSGDQAGAHALRGLGAEVGRAAGGAVPNTVTSQGAGGGTWAVVIGVNDYPGSGNDLSSAVNDAERHGQALGALGVGDDHMLVLRDGQVTSNTLLESVSWLASSRWKRRRRRVLLRRARAQDQRRQRGDRHERRLVGDRQRTRQRAEPGAGEPLVGRDGGVFRRRLRRSAAAWSCAYGRPARTASPTRTRPSAAATWSSTWSVRRSSGPRVGHGADGVQLRGGPDPREHPGREPMQIDNSNGALDLRPPGGNARPPEQSEPQPDPSSPPAEEPPASDRPATDQHCTGRDCSATAPAASRSLVGDLHR